MKEQEVIGVVNPKGELTLCERTELNRLILLARKKAAVVGPMHSAWDSIFDAEAILRGQPAVISDAGALIHILREYDTCKKEI